MQDEDHFERIFDILDLIEEKEVRGKVREVVMLLRDSMPSGDDFDSVGGTSEQVSLIRRRAWMKEHEAEAFVALIVESKGLSETQLNRVIKVLERPVMMLEPDVGELDEFRPYGISPKMVLMLKAITRAVPEHRYFTRKEVFGAYLDLDPSASYTHGFPTTLRNLGKRGILTYNRYALNCVGEHLLDFNARLTTKFLNFMEESGVELEDLEKTANTTEYVKELEKKNFLTSRFQQVAPAPSAYVMHEEEEDDGYGGEKEDS